MTFIFSPKYAVEKNYLKIKTIWYKSPCLSVPKPMHTAKSGCIDILRLYPFLTINQLIYRCLSMTRFADTQSYAYDQTYFRNWLYTHLASIPAINHSINKWINYMNCSLWLVEDTDINVYRSNTYYSVNITPDHVCSYICMYVWSE